jgi:hypothetical protein
MLRETIGDYDLLGVGNPGPDWDSAYRPGDNLYTDSTIALDADTGKIKWHFQHTPNDPFDYDSVAETVLADVAVEGKSLQLALEAYRKPHMKAPLLILVAAMVLVAGSGLAIMNNACKSGHHAWCAPMSNIWRHVKTRHS